MGRDAMRRDEVDPRRLQTDRGMCAVPYVEGHGREADALAPPGGSRSVLLQSTMDGLGELTFEVSQPQSAMPEGRGGGRGRSADYSGLHGQLPPDRVHDYPDRIPRALEGVRDLLSGVEDHERDDHDDEEAADCEGPAPTTWRLTAAGWLPDASDIAPAGSPEAYRARTRCRWRYGESSGRSRFSAHARRSATMDNTSAPLLLGAAFVPFPTGGVPLTYFESQFDLFVGSAAQLDAPSPPPAVMTRETPLPKAGEPRGGLESDSGGGTRGGLWICYSDLDPSDLAALVAPFDGVDSPAYAGRGVCAVLRAASGAYGGRVAAIVHDGVVVARAAPIAIRADAWLPLQLMVSADGCTLRHNGVTLLDSVPLASWNPAAHWRLVLVALTEGIPGDAYWVDNLRVTSAALLPHAPAPFEVSLNGQDFTNASFTFSYHAAPMIESIYPPGGPLSGATHLSVRGIGFAHGSDYRCMFGNVSVPASLDGASGGRAVTCASPATATTELSWLDESGGDVSFAIALNGQNYYGGDENVFEYHGALRLSAVMPPTGPTSGGIRFNVTGARLGGGSDYRCCLVAEAQPCNPDGTSVTRAIYDATTDLLVCSSPPVFNGGGAYQLRISLNGAQFSFEPYQTLGFCTATRHRMQHGMA